MVSVKHYDECYFVDYDSYEDLNLYEVGCQNCIPNYSFGPIIRNNYVLHYILNGCGKLLSMKKNSRFHPDRHSLHNRIFLYTIKLMHPTHGIISGFTLTDKKP